MENTYRDSDIAIIGMSGSFPGSKTIPEFWENVLSGNEMISSFSNAELEDSPVSQALYKNSNYIPRKGVIETPEFFDPEFFNISDKEAELMDPQHRLLLEHAWKTLDDAGYHSEDLSGKISLIVGSCGMGSYLTKNLLKNPDIVNNTSDYYLTSNNLNDFLTTKVAYKLNFTGPCYTVQTACSTSLVAIALAVMNLRQGLCDLALAGGVALTFPSKSGYLYKNGLIFSKSGHCRPFTTQADGTVMGNGLGLIALKRLKDAIIDKDNIYSIIKGVGLSNDGHTKVAFTAPSALGQSKAIEAALKDADVAPNSVSYIETHGTGTEQGDPIEISGLSKVYANDNTKVKRCVLGTLKSNIGHLDSAAGAAGLIKMSLALKYKMIPANTFAEDANSRLVNTPFYMTKTKKVWMKNGNPRRAGVSSFGMGGTNAHVILEEAPDINYSGKMREHYILPLSAKSSTALLEMQKQLLQHLKEVNLNIEDLAYTLQLGRENFPHKTAFACSNKDELISLLKKSIKLYNSNESPVLLNISSSINSKIKFEILNEWFDGETKNWVKYNKGYAGKRISLPSYPFEHKRCWISPRMENVSNKNQIKNSPDKNKKNIKLPEKITQKIIQAWTKHLGSPDISEKSNFFDLGGDSLIAIDVANDLEEEFSISIDPVLILECKTLKAFRDHLLTLTANTDKNKIKITKQKELEIFPLSETQERIYSLSICDPLSNISYNVPVTFSLRGKLSVENLKKSMELLWNRHVALRTNFTYNDGDIQQIVRKDQALFFLTEKATSFDIDKKLLDHIKAPFDLERDPLLKIYLFELNKNEYILLINMHHIVCDGWSINILIKELSTIYSAFLKKETPVLHKLEYQYKDYCISQKSWINDNILKNQVEYWTNELNGFTPVTLPTDHTRPDNLENVGSQFLCPIDPSLSKRISELSKSLALTDFVLYLAAFKLLLSYYTNQTDISIGIPMANRNCIDSENLVGCFVNTLILRSELTSDMSISDFLSTLGKKCLKANSNQDAPLALVLESLKKNTKLSDKIISVLFAFQNANKKLTPNLENISVDYLPSHHGASKFDLTVNIFSDESNYSLSIEYNSLLYKKETIEDFSYLYISMLNSIALNQDQKISNINLLDSNNYKKIAHKFCCEKDEIITTKNFKYVFEEQVKKNPDDVALIYNEKPISYSLLNKMADDLSTRILNNYEIQKTKNKTKRVILFLQPSEKVIISIIAILKIGFSFVPVDPNTPAQRISSILNSTKPFLTLSEESIISRLELFTDKYKILNLDKNNNEKMNIDLRNYESLLDDEAYVLFTSGSTGEPKAIPIKNKCLMEKMQWLQNKFALTSVDTVAYRTKYVFDISMNEIIWPLCFGAKVAIASHELNDNMLQLKNYIIKNKITKIQFVPSLLSAFLEITNNDDINNLNNVTSLLILGESFSNTLARKCNHYFQKAKIYNLYGPTEATIFATCYEYQTSIHMNTTSKSVPIGMPAGGAKLYVLNNNLKPMPIGIPGELYISGNLASGYLNNTDKSKKNFINNPFNTSKYSDKHAFLYKTGDQVRWLSDGNLEFISRLDNQVKIRGNRIELDEIKNTLCTHPNIIDSAITIYTHDDEKYLLAYYISDISDNEFSLKNTLVKYLNDRIPSYMVPNFFIRLKKLPISNSGKLDKKSLPLKKWSELIAENTKKNNSDKMNKIESTVASIWKKILKVDSIALNDSFFDLGGHSLAATRFIAAVKKEIGLDLSIKEIFQSPTLRSVSKYIKTCQKNISKNMEIKSIGFRKSYPVTPFQEISYALNKEDIISDSKNNYFVTLSLTGNLLVNELERAINILVNETDSFRTFFSIEDNKLVVKIIDFLKFTINETQIKKSDVNTQLYKDAYKEIDLQDKNLWHINLYTVKKGEHYLSLVVHPTIMDGISIKIILNRIQTIYTSLVQKKPYFPPKKTMRYVDFTSWYSTWINQAEFKKQLEYWHEKLRTLVPVNNEEAIDSLGLKENNKEGDRYEVILDAKKDSLYSFCSKHNTTPYITALTCLSALLPSTTNKKHNVIIGSPISCRHYNDIEETIGNFVNILPITCQISKDSSFLDNIKTIGNEFSNVYANKDINIEHIIKQSNLCRYTAYKKLFGTIFSYKYSDTLFKIELPDLIINRLYPTDDLYTHSIMFSIEELSNDLKFTIKYRKNKYEYTFIQKIVSKFQNTLNYLLDNETASTQDILSANLKNKVTEDVS